MWLGLNSLQAEGLITYGYLLTMRLLANAEEILVD